MCAQANTRLDPVDNVVRCRGAGRQPYHLRSIEPFGANVGVGLDVMHAGTVARAGLDKLARVVAGAATDDDNDVGLTRHLDRRRLPFLGGLADSVNESHVRLGESLSNQRDQPSHLFDRLRRLCRNADTMMLLEAEDVIVFEHDVKAIEIAGQAMHLYVIALPDDDDVVAVAGESGDGTVRDAHERAGGFDGC